MRSLGHDGRDLKVPWKQMRLDHYGECIRDCWEGSKGFVGCGWWLGNCREISQGSVECGECSINTDSGLITVGRDIRDS